MKKKKKWIKWVVILVIVAAVVGWFMMVSRKTQDVAYTNVQATLGSIETYYNFDGLVKAKRVQTITAAQSDKVRTVYVTQNQQVKKGERLYRLEGGETVEADIAGEVTGLYVEQGGVVTAGETTAQIIDMNSLEIELNVDEYDVAAVVPGQVVQVNVLAPDVSFTGSVTALNKNGTASGDLSYYTATVAFDAAENVYPGMQVSAKVLKEQAEDAVLLRQDAVQFDDYNKPYVLVRVGLKDRMHHYQNQLSGGQQQRVAIARALATNPTLLLADEPTGALDQATGEQVMALFRELNDEGRTIVMITHDLKIARHASRFVNILDGVLSEGVSAYD